MNNKSAITYNKNDFNALIVILVSNLKKRCDVLREINNSFYKFLDENPELKEDYKKFAAGHPEETWGFQSKTDQEHVDHAKHTDEQLDETEKRTRHSVR